MNLNYKGLINILGLQKWLDRLTTLETTVANLPTPTGDGNGIYSSSDVVTEGTLATILEGSGNSAEFAMGTFPSWPDINETNDEFGFYFAPGYSNSIGMQYGNARISITGSTPGMINGSNYIQISATGFEVTGPANSIKLNNTKIFAGAGTPEGVITAPVGSTFHRTDGGAGTSFYVKESGIGNTGWVAK